MTELQASRTLVKSPPELWAECSDAAALARHLGRFGEIRITRLEPETAVAWEGERARGTVRIEPSGWGTKVVLTAVAVAEADEVPAVADEVPAVADEVPAVADEVPVVVDDLTPPLPRRRFARLRAFLRGDPRRAPDPAPPAPASAPANLGVPDAQAALDAALDSLGQAHHRPFSRA
jgi:hypothetical protein